MFYYKRKTSFIDYYINGIKSRCVGIVKQKATAETLELYAEVFGLEDWKNIICRVNVGNAEVQRHIFEMNIQNGTGKGEGILPTEWLQKEKYTKIFFSFGNDCYGIADLCECPEQIQLPELGGVAEIAATPEQFGQENDTDTQEEERLPEAVDVKENIEAMDITEQFQEQEVLAECLQPQPDKWEVIQKKYPILYPFKGQGPYVSIKPVDLQLLDSAYYHLSNNSFLMHNFYKYKHLILGKYTWEKGTFFYVGVPGEFIKKEQNAAAMFGFEGYEHSGDLGYYLYRVEL